MRHNAGKHSCYTYLFNIFVHNYQIRLVLFITAAYVVFGKVMFSVMSVCLYTGRWSQVNKFEEVHVVGRAKWVLEG